MKTTLLVLGIAVLLVSGLLPMFSPVRAEEVADAEVVGTEEGVVTVPREVCIPFVWNVFPFTLCCGLLDGNFCSLWNCGLGVCGNAFSGVNCGLVGASCNPFSLFNVGLTLSTILNPCSLCNVGMMGAWLNPCSLCNVGLAGAWLNPCSLFNFGLMFGAVANPCSLCNLGMYFGALANPCSCSNCGLVGAICNPCSLLDIESCCNICSLDVLKSLLCGGGIPCLFLSNCIACIGSFCAPPSQRHPGSFSPQ